MERVTIHTDSTISVGDTITGYCVVQERDGTKVLPWHNNGLARPRDLGAEVRLPKTRYALSSDKDRADFDAAFLAAWNAAQ